MGVALKKIQIEVSNKNLILINAFNKILEIKCKLNKYLGV